MLDMDSGKEDLYVKCHTSFTPLSNNFACFLLDASLFVADDVSSSSVCSHNHWITRTPPLLEFDITALF